MIYMDNEYLALNNPQELMCHKTQTIITKTYYKHLDIEFSILLNQISAVNLLYHIMALNLKA